MVLPTFVPFDAFWLTVALLLVASAGSLARLRKRHPILWKELGSPAFLPTRGTEGLMGSAALSRFYWSRRVAALGDPGLTRWVTALRGAQLALGVVLVALAVQLAGGPR